MSAAGRPAAAAVAPDMVNDSGGVGAMLNRIGMAALRPPNRAALAVIRLSHTQPKHTPPPD